LYICNIQSESLIITWFQYQASHLFLPDVTETTSQATNGFISLPETQDISIPGVQTCQDASCTLSTHNGEVVQ
jgi:hypothetical protein